MKKTILFFLFSLFIFPSCQSDLYEEFYDGAVPTEYLDNNCYFLVAQTNDNCRAVSVSCEGGETFGPVEVCGINTVDTVYYLLIDTMYVDISGECPMYFTLWEKNGPSGVWWEFRIWSVDDGTCYCPEAKLEVWPLENSNLYITLSSTDWELIQQADLLRAEGEACQSYSLIRLDVTNFNLCEGFRWKLVTEGGSGAGGQVVRIP